MSLRKRCGASTNATQSASETGARCNPCPSVACVSHLYLLLICDEVLPLHALGTSLQCRCAVCRARKSRCIARHTGAYERCVEKGEECDLYAPQALDSPAISSTAISSTAIASGHQINASFPQRDRIQENSDTPSSLKQAQIRVLGRSANSNVTVSTPSAAQAASETSPTSMTSDCRAQTLDSQSPIPGGQSEDAILIVEDIGRTRRLAYTFTKPCTYFGKEYTGLRPNESFLLYVQEIFHATTRNKALGTADRSSTVCDKLKNEYIQGNT